MLHVSIQPHLHTPDQIASQKDGFLQHVTGMVLFVLLVWVAGKSIRVLCSSVKRSKSRA
jgi:hypothetical protein